MMPRAQGCGDAGEADVNAGDHYVTWRVMEEIRRGWVQALLRIDHSVNVSNCSHGHGTVG